MVDLETVTVRNDLEDLPAVYTVLDRFCTGAGLSDAVRRTLCLVVEELFANTVAYGYPDGGKDQIAVTAALGPTHVKLVLSDRARPFDNSGMPSGPPEADTVEDMGIGGLGLYLVHQLADDVATQRIGNVNHTTVLVPRAKD
ncbi:serine-protein kinase RsbW [Labrenzia sp. THAF35]|uniref:ATP-binding protein n=1 Tax=Labrenzia sp. THAF35 TaxID=2587854 RepID=UPI001267F0AC|nr:ATP-binding protein [Labrenzia sp. THAF35]QFT65997.1 serine-protein kinase RsbW [Labrenzia sp. THAF35]